MTRFFTTSLTALLLVTLNLAATAPIAHADDASPAVAITQTASTTEKEIVYTGLVIDARHLATIDRSPAPTLYGPIPDAVLLYPDRAHVPTPDEVQEQSIVRYYHSEDDAKKGFVGAEPLIIKAVEVVGTAHDGLRISAEDMVRVQELEKKIGFTRTWKVGFLLPADK